MNTQVSEPHTASHQSCWSYHPQNHSGMLLDKLGQHTGEGMARSPNMSSMSLEQVQNNLGSLVEDTLTASD